MAHALQTIESHDYSIADIFKSFYIVPDYQREYSWKKEQIDELLEDLQADFKSRQPGNEYFLGSIVVCRRPASDFELIDGQQRITTLFLIYAAANAYLKGLGKDGEAFLDTLHAKDLSAEGAWVARFRVELQYDDSKAILRRIVSGKVKPGHILTTTPSVENLTNAYDIIHKSLSNTFKEDSKTMLKFMGYLGNHVKLIRIEAGSLTYAIKVFETINARGKSLGALDLLKNLLFTHCDENQWEKLKTRWRSLVEAIGKSKERPLRFLRYFILAFFEKTLISEDDIYQWFKTNRKECKIETEPLEFVDSLIKAAEDYANLLGVGQNRYLKNISCLSTTSRQHLIVLLAAHHLGSEAIIALSRELENLYFAYRISGRITRDLEAKFVLWGASSRELQSLEDLQKIVIPQIRSERYLLAPEFVAGLDTLNEGSLAKYQLRYLLGKLAQYFEEAAYGPIGNDDLRKKFITSKIDIEHILPQDLSAKAVAEFGAGEDAQAYVGRLGNLTIVEDSVNRSLGNQPFSKKRPVYKSSNLLITKTIGEKFAVGKNTKPDKVATKMPCFADWNPASLAAREKFLRETMHEIWDVPDRGR